MEYGQRQTTSSARAKTNHSLPNVPYDICLHLQWSEGIQKLVIQKVIVLHNWNIPQRLAESSKISSLC
ncbi:hypothetical protein Csa_018156 [Cucumis sativus]|uniref:Uncharacterized protein n=1 Tax=Cucumis sativus TaxID=3659 RepID=A0A0A0L0J5_CUCSA|nr:hypothetical protein Csa_018156 [Cucumis sativus]